MAVTHPGFTHSLLPLSPTPSKHFLVPWHIPYRLAHTLPFGTHQAHITEYAQIVEGLKLQVAQLKMELAQEGGQTRASSAISGVHGSGGGSYVHGSGNGAGTRRKENGSATGGNSSGTDLRARLRTAFAAQLEAQQRLLALQEEVSSTCPDATPSPPVLLRFCCCCRYLPPRLPSLLLSLLQTLSFQCPVREALDFDTMGVSIYIRHLLDLARKQNLALALEMNDKTLEIEDWDQNRFLQVPLPEEDPDNVVGCKPL